MAKRATYKTTVRQELENAGSEIESLAEEMRSWYDNLPENLQNGDKGSRISEAADTLENFDSRTVDSLVRALAKACDGVPEKPGCVEHVFETPCKACGWSGKRPKPLDDTLDPPPKFRICDPPEKSPWSGKPIFAVYETNCSSVWIDGAPGEDASSPSIKAQIESLRARYEENMRWREIASQAHLVPPPIKPTVPAVEPNEALKKKLDEEYEVQSPAKRRSRADRLCDATSSLRQCTETLREVFPDEDTSDLAEEVRSACDEIDSACDDLESVEFPGMYG